MKTVVIGWLIACALFILWASGELDLVLTRLTRTWKELSYWLKEKR